MTEYLLIPGAGGRGWYWSRVVPLLEQTGHRAVALDLPADDPDCGLAEYAACVVAATGGGPDIVLVGMSLGAFTVPLVCEQLDVRELVFVNAMIPAVGEVVAEWGENTGSTAARLQAARERGYSTDFDEQLYFFHDVPADLVVEAADHQMAESDKVWGESVTVSRWRDVPTRVLAGRDDRLFPATFQRGIARDRLGVEADVIPGGHLMALSNPQGVADYLLRSAHAAPAPR